MSDEPDLDGRDVAHDTSEVVQVHLLAAPLVLLVRAREHHDGLMREFRVLALSDQDAAPDAPRRLVELAEVLGRQLGAVGSRCDEEVDQALGRGELVRDLHYDVGVGVVEAVRTLEALMTEADAYCAAEKLMTVERPPLMKRFASWYLGQFVTQCAGGPASPWDGPLSWVED
ncbi:MAG: hypothetical protein H7323_11850 [Frankiales bacterium]|nr:hypothetical protein [Frankiales bacterium]